MTYQPQNTLQQFSLTNKTALITGGSQGLGEVIAHTLAAAGATTIIVSRTLQKCQTVAADIKSLHQTPSHAYAADISHSNEVDQLFDTITKEVGNVDILVNCAGLNIRGPIATLTEQNWDDVLNINLKAPFLMARKFGPPMADRGWGRIIQLGSILSTIGIEERTPYASSKAGVLGLTRTLALEWATKGVTINALCPGPFATEMNRPLLNDPEKYAAFVKKIPMGRWGELHEIAAPALFLASSASSFMTGTTLYIDGGWTAQ